MGDALVVQRLFDAVPLMLLGAVGPEHRVVAATEVYRQYVGREELVGATLRESFPEAAGQQVFSILDRVFATGQAESLREFRVHFQRPDLGNEWVENFIDLTLYPWLADDGSVRGVIVHPVDVTQRVRERRAAQARAAEAQRRCERVRDVIDALQRELLPAVLPVLPGLQVAAAYLPADAEAAAGGDWFDALALGDGRVALMAGDVVGHGLAASATMGQLRVVLRERLAASGDILAALRALNEAAAWIPGAQAATACVVLLNPATGALSYCTAGHPPPLLLPQADSGRFLPVTGAGPLGVRGAFTDEHVGAGRLERGAMVLLYTDGILERPGRPLPQATVELVEAATDVAANRVFRDGLPPAERLCVQTLELLTRVSGHTDDITLLAGQRVDPPEALRLRLPARTEELTSLRTRLTEWLAVSGAGPAASEAVRHAVLELATNCVVHAYPAAGGDRDDFTVTAALDETGQVEVRVADHGTWREPRPSGDGGYGLRMAVGLVDRLQVTHDDRGTVATVGHALTRPARLLTADQLPCSTAVSSSAQADPLLVLDQPWAPEPRVRVDGPLDATTASRAERAVRAAGAAGAQDLTVDLAGVTHLGSAGVAALHRLDAEHRASNTSLRLYAPTASPADLILTLVNLPHATSDPHPPPPGRGAG